MGREEKEISNTEKIHVGIPDKGIPIKTSHLGFMFGEDRKNLSTSFQNIEAKLRLGVD